MNTDALPYSELPPSSSSDLKDEEQEPVGPSNPNLVEWDGPNDPGNPVNLPKARKWLATICFSLLNFTTTFASSVFSSAGVPASKYFHVSEEVMVLGTSLYLCGFIGGPFIFGYVPRFLSRAIFMQVVQSTDTVPAP